MINSFDTPWKEILEIYFKDFIAFFLPVAHDSIDWERGYEFLDKELLRITREAKTGTRTMDRLVKVWQKNGVEQWVLIHVDIQGDPEKEFPVRMFVYYYRAYDLKGWPVVGLAILTDDQKNWRPTEHRQEIWGCEEIYRFNMVKLMDYEERLEELESSTNPFAIVTWAHLQAKKTRLQVDKRFQAKWFIIRSLYKRGFSRQQILDIFRFVDWVMDLPKEEDRLFWNQLTQMEEVEKMPYITSVERIGMERGLAKGVTKGMAEMLLGQLQERYGLVPEWITIKLGEADSETLKGWSRKIFGAEKIEEIFI